jgi:thiol-disulfide isomerase/thioredoxin
LNNRALLLVLVIAALAAGGGYALHRYLAAGSGDEELIGARLPTGIRLNDLDGTSHVFEEWRGKLLIVNFWATWCGPCLEEMPEFVKAQQKYGARGLQVVGPAVDDPDAARQTAASLHINYPILTATPEVMLGVMRKVGNDAGGLPFSVIVAPDGSVIDRRLGALSADEIEKLVAQHLPR